MSFNSRKYTGRYSHMQSMAHKPERGLGLSCSEYVLAAFIAVGLVLLIAMLIAVL